MPLTERCPGCQKFLVLPEALLGQVVSCPSCRRSYTAGGDERTAPAQANTSVAVSAPSLRNPPQLVKAPSRADLEWEEDSDAQPHLRAAGSLPGGRRTVVAVVCLAWWSLACGTSILVNLAQPRGLRTFPTAETRLWHEVVVYLNITLLALLVLCCIVVGMWIYRAHKNAAELGITGKDTSPDWAVGWFFIPIGCYFAPCQAMWELWKTSDPRFGRRRYEWDKAPGTVLIGLWWASWLVMLLFGQLTWPGAAGQYYIGDDRSLSLVNFVNVVGILAAAFLICIILLVRRRQVQKFQALGEREADAEDRRYDIYG